MVVFKSNACTRVSHWTLFARSAIMPSCPTFTTSRFPYAREFLGAALSGSSHLPWPSLSLTSLALPCFPVGANISTLQDSLYITGCYFALPSQEDTTLQHNQSPDCTGCLLRGRLTVTTVGLSPTSRRQLSGHTMHWLCGALLEIDAAYRYWPILQTSQLGW